MLHFPFTQPTSKIILLKKKIATFLLNRPTGWLNQLTAMSVSFYPYVFSPHPTAL